MRILFNTPVRNAWLLSIYETFNYVFIKIENMFSLIVKAYLYYFSRNFIIKADTGTVKIEGNCTGHI